MVEFSGVAVNIVLIPWELAVAASAASVVASGASVAVAGEDSSNISAVVAAGEAVLAPRGLLHSHSSTGRALVCSSSLSINVENNG